MLIARNQFQADASWSAACSLSKLDVGTVEFEDALGVAADEDAILFDKNGIGVKARSVRGVELICGFAIPVLVKTQKPVMQCDPDFPAGANNADGGDYGFEGGLLALALLAFNFLSGGLRGGESLDFSELNGLGSVSVAVVLANRRLRSVDKRVVDVPARVSSEVAGVQITIHILA